jgi:RNA polymerase sigma factor for flagellar operon FliA
MGTERDKPTAGTGSEETAVLTERNDIIEQHMWLVNCIARSIADALPRQVDVDDLISAGTMGLIKAVDDFDPSKGAKLETYARYRIKGSILDELRKQDLLPYSTRCRLKQLDKAILELERTLGRHPTDEEIAGHTGLSPQEISRLLDMVTGLDLYSLDQILENGEANLRIDLTEALANSPDPLGRLEKEELTSILVEGIRDLPETEKTVLGLYYYEGLRMKEIGEVLGISESRVSQIHSRAVLLLRNRLRVHLLR